MYPHDVGSCMNHIANLRIGYTYAGYYNNL